MLNNKYLLVLCTLLIVSMGYIRNINTDNASLLAQARDIVIESKEKTDQYEIDKNILIADELSKASISEDKKKLEKPEIPPPRPDISVEAYLIGNIETGEIYMSNNVDSVFPIASLSKLYTALVVHHLFNLSEKIPITQSVIDTYGDSGHLVLGEKFLPNELMYPLLLESSNDAAQAFDEYFGHDKFITAMNELTKEIEMNSTYFVDASGLSPQNVSKTSDLFKLAQYLYKNEKDILEISRTKEISMPKTDEHESHNFININPYSNYNGFIGGKTGRTEWAKESMISLFNQNIQDVNFPLAIIILRSDIGQREINTEKLLGKFMDKVSIN